MRASSSEPPRPLGRALGVDYGRRGVGLAVSTLGLAPRPLMTLDPTAEGTMLELSRKVVDVAKTEGREARWLSACAVGPPRRPSHAPTRWCIWAQAATES